MAEHNRRIIIIGGVAGGASCATRLRRHNETIDIILLERGPYVSFANCGLPYYIGGTIQDKNSLFLAEKRYNLGVDTYLNTLISQRNLYSSEQNLISLRLTKISNRATLYKVLANDVE